MSLHHFRKEFRYLRLRWFVFLALLAFDLAVNLEWLFPLRAGVQPPAWLAHLPTVLMLVGASLLGSCPEDKPGSDRSFISTRPLPLRSYWLARIALWLLLLIAPVVIQTALYLLLSGRPGWEVITSSWHRTLQVIGLTAWVLPMTALWRRGEFWAALGCLAATWLLADRLMEFIAIKVAYISLNYIQSSLGKTVTDLLFAFCVLALAWRHQTRRTATFRRRLFPMLGLALLCLTGARLWPWNERDAPGDLARAQQLASALSIQSDLSGYEFAGFEDDRQRQMFVAMRSTTGDASVSVQLRPQQSLITQGTDYASRSTSNIYWRSRRFSFQRSSETLWATDAVLRDLFPPGTLFTTLSEHSMWNNYMGTNYNVAQFKAPYPNPEQPLRVTTDFDVDWHQRDLALDVPLLAGSTAQSADHVWRILQVQENKEENGNPALGHVSLELHVQSPSGNLGPLANTTMLLWSPQRRLVWLEPSYQTLGPSRASASRWTRHTVRLGWRGVLNYADGESTGVDVSQLRLVMLRSRFLGTTQWTWNSPNIRLRDHINSMDMRSFRDQPIYRGREARAFKERLATLPPPSADAPAAQVRRYLYDILALTNITGVTNTSPNLKEITDAFRPLMQHHLPLMLEIPSSLWPGWSNKPPRSLLQEYLTDDYRETVIDLVPTSAVLTSTVIDKGWAEHARRLQPYLFSLPKLPYRAEYLLLKWGDAASYEKLMQEQRRKPENDIFKALDKIPDLRPRLEELSREIVRHEIPLLKSHAYWLTTHRAIAADFGSVENLDICLRWIAMGGDLPAPNSGVPRPHLLKADGSKLWEPKVDSEKQWPRYRHLTPADFEYLPEQRAWRLRQP